MRPDSTCPTAARGISKRPESAKALTAPIPRVARITNLDSTLAAQRRRAPQIRNEEDGRIIHEGMSTENVLPANRLATGLID